MAIQLSDILIKYAITSGSAGNTVAQTNQNNSLGKWISTTVYLGNSVNDLFAPINGVDNANSVVTYRCLFIHNNHGSLSFDSIAIWVTSITPSGPVYAIGVDPTAASAVGAGVQQAVLIPNENTAPAGVTFSSPGTEGAGLSVGQLLAGQTRAIWIRRTAQNSGPINSDSATLNFSGDSAA